MGVRKLRLDIKVAGLVHIGNGQRYGKGIILCMAVKSQCLTCESSFRA